MVVAAVAAGTVEALDAVGAAVVLRSARLDMHGTAVLLRTVGVEATIAALDTNNSDLEGKDDKKKSVSYKLTGGCVKLPEPNPCHCDAPCPGGYSLSTGTSPPRRHDGREAAEMAMIEAEMAAADSLVVASIRFAFLIVRWDTFGTSRSSVLWQ